MTIQQTIEDLGTQLTSCIAMCRARMRSKEVHSLRTYTRRLEAVLRMVKTDHRRAKKAIKAMGALLDLLGKVRKAAGLVRDSDVQRKIVSRIGRQWVKDPEDERRDEITEDIERLSKRVERERKTHARGLRKVLSAIELPLQERLVDCEDKLASLPPGNTAPYQHAEHWLAASKHHDRFQKPKDLHEFRKETKGVRYVAELQPELRSSIALARDLRSMNDAIGSWHDYEMLAAEARSWIGKKSPLTKAIIQQRNRRWKIALRMVDSMKKKHAALFAS